MQGISFDTVFNYDPLVRGLKTIRSNFESLYSFVERFGGSVDNIFKRLTEGGRAEEVERKAREIANVFNSLVGNINVSSDAAVKAKDRIGRALDDMANSTEKPKERFRRFAEEMSAVMNEIRASEAPVGDTNHTSAINSLQQRLNLENNILDVLEKQKATAETRHKVNTEGLNRNKSNLSVLEDRLSQKYDGAAEGFYSDEDKAELAAAREVVENWRTAWENSNTAIQTCSALIDDVKVSTEKAKDSVDSLNNVYKGFADTAQSTSTKIFISEEVFNRYNELLGTIDNLKEQIKEVSSQDDIDLPKLQGLQDQLASAQEEFRSLDGAARHTAEVLGSDLAGKTSNALEKLYNLNALVRNSSDEVAKYEQQLKDAKRELAEAKDPAAITLAKQKVDELSVSLDKACDDLSRFKAERKDAVDEVKRLSKDVESGGTGNSSDITKEVGSQVKSIMGNIAAIAGIGLGLSELKDFFNQSKEWRMYFQDIESSFKVFLGSAEKGTEFTEKLQKYAYYNMFEFSDLAAASQQMISYGHDVDSIIPRLDQLSNVATGTHGSIMELVDAYNRAKATGVVDARGVQSWAVKGVMIRDVLRDLGETTAGTTITFEQLNKVLDHVTGEGGQFHNLMGEMMSNVSAEAGQLEDNLSLMFNEVGTQYEDVFVRFLKLQGDIVDNYRDIGGGMLDFGVEAATVALEKLEENWRTIVDVIKGAVVAYGAFKATMIVHNATVAAGTTVTRLATIAQEMNAGASYKQASAIAAATVKGDLETAAKIRSTIALNANTAAKGANTAATVTLGSAIKGLTAAMLSNPLVLAATAIAGIAYVCYQAYEGIMTQEKAQRLLTKAEEDYMATIEEKQQSANNQIAVIQNKTASLMAQTKAYRDLIAEHEIFAKFSKEEIANMSTEQKQGLLEEEKTKEEEEGIRKRLAVAEELQERFKSVGGAWAHIDEDSDIDEVVKKYKLLPEYAEELKQSIGAFTNLKDWANQLKEGANTRLQEFLTREAEAGVVEGIKKGIANDSLKGDVTKLLSDYGKQMGEGTAKQEKSLADARARLARIESGEEKFDSSTERSHVLNDTKAQIESISDALVKTRKDIGKTFGDAFSDKASQAKEKVDELEHAVATATGSKKTELEFQLKTARDEYDTLQSILKLVEAGNVDTEIVMRITREADNAILGDEKLVEIGKGYEQIDELGQKFTNAWATAKEEMDAVGEGSEKTAEKVTAAWEKSSAEVFASLDKTEEELSKNITDLESEQDGLKKKFGETYKDTEEYRKLELEITRKKEQLTYLQDLKKDLKKIAENPFSIWIDIKTKVSDKVKGLLKNFLSDDMYKKLFGDEEIEKSVSQTAQDEGKKAQENIDEKKNKPTTKTGDQWKSEETKQLRADLKAINDELKKPIDKKRYDELMRQKSQIESALKKGDAAAKKLLAQRAKQLQDQWKHEEQMESLMENAQRAQEDASIASIANRSRREHEEREKQHRRTMEDLEKQRDEIFKKIYQQRKEAYKSKHNDKDSLEYELTPEGKAGWKGIADEWKALSAKSLDEVKEKEFEIIKASEVSTETLQKLNDLSSKGNVDLISRPFIDAAELVKKGWKDAGEGIATVFSSSYKVLDSKGEAHEILVTPILPDGEVWSERELRDYINKAINGAEDILSADKEGVVIAVDIEGNEGEALHKLQEQLIGLPTDKIEEIKKLYESLGHFSKDEQSQYDLWMKTIDAKQTEASKKRKRERDEELKATKKALRDNIMQSGSFFQQQLAIFDEYQAKIDQLDPVLDKEQIEILEKERDDKLDSKRAEDILGRNDWSGLFDGIGNQFKEEMKASLDEITEYMKSQEFANLPQSQKNEFYRVRGELNDKVGKGEMPFDFSKLNTAAEQLRLAWKELITASNKHRIAVDARKRAEENLEEAQDKLDKATDANREVLEADVKRKKEALELARKIEDSTGESLLVAQNKTEQSKNDFIDSTQKSISSINNFSQSLGELTNGTLFGFVNGIYKLVNSFSSAEGAMDKVANGISGAGVWGAIIAAILQLIDTIGDDLPGFIRELLMKVSNLVEGVLTDLIPDLIPSIVNGIGDLLRGVVNGVVNLLGSIVGFPDLNLFSRGETREEMLERLRETLEDNTHALEKSTEALEKQYQTQEERERNRQEAIDFYNKSVDDARASIEALAGNDSGGHHSWWYERNKEWKKESKKEGSNWVSIINDTLAKYGFNERVSGEGMQSLMFLSPEALRAVRDHSGIWTQIFNGVNANNAKNSDVKNAFEDLADYADGLKDIEEKFQEGMTNISFDSMRDNLRSTFLDMKSDTNDFTKDFENDFRDMMASIMIDQWFNSEETQKTLKDYYELLAEYSKDGLEKWEREELKRRYDEIKEEGLRKRNETKDALGYEDEAKQQSATANSIANISYDQADALEGILLNHTILFEQGNVMREQIAMFLQTLQSIHTSGINEVRNLLIEGNNTRDNILRSMKLFFENFDIQVERVITEIKNS